MNKQVVSAKDVAKVSAKDVAKPEVKVESAPAAAPKPEAKPTLIKILKTDAKFRDGARLLWYTELKKWDGKPVKDFDAHVLANPPSTPKKGALAGKCEPPAGWRAYFKREGVMQEVTPA